MTKQEEIRGGIAKILADLYCGYGAWIHDKDLDKILFYLHSQGVVIEVERELPSIMSEFGSYKLGWQILNEMIEAGYVAVELLIKEDSNG